MSGWRLSIIWFHYMGIKIRTLIKRPSETELDNLWRKAAILRTSVCEFPFCHKTEHLNAHHIYSRSRKSVRWDLDNSLVLCPFHHSLGNDSAHKSPDFKQVMIDNGIRTREFWDKLECKAKTPVKVDRNLEKLYLDDYLKKFLI